MERVNHTQTKKFFIFITSLFIALMVQGMPVSAAASKVVCRVETERSVLPAGPGQDIILKVTLDAPPAPRHIRRPAVNLSLVLDQSGSMGGTKIEQAKEAAIEALSRLGAEDMFSVVVYDSNVHTIVPAQNAGNVQGIIRMIRQIRPGGSTALFGGVSHGAAEIRKFLDRDYVHRIVLLSDGIANVGPRTPEDLGRLGAALIKEGISVSTVGVGTDYNEDLMARLAQKSDGNTYFVESGYDLPRIFAGELGDVLNVVAKKVRVDITLPDSVRAVDIIGREGRINGQKIELFMNQLYGDQEKYALIKVHIPESKTGSRMVVAQAEVSYEDPFTQRTEKSSGTSWASFSRDVQEIEASTNIGVVKEYQLNLNALAQERAIELSDKGKKEEAVQELKQSAAVLKKIGSRYKDEELLKEADALEMQADTIESEGMTKKSRKVLRTRSYQQKYQQQVQ